MQNIYLFAAESSAQPDQQLQPQGLVSPKRPRLQTEAADPHPRIEASTSSQQQQQQPGASLLSQLPRPQHSHTQDPVQPRICYRVSQRPASCTCIGPRSCPGRTLVRMQKATIHLSSLELHALCLTCGPGRQRHQAGGPERDDPAGVVLSCLQARPQSSSADLEKAEQLRLMPSLCCSPGSRICRAIR